MIITISIIQNGFYTIAADKSQNVTNGDFYAVVEKAETISNQTSEPKASVFEVISNGRIKLYDSSTNKYIGTLVYTVTWIVSDGSYVKYSSSNAYFEGLDSSYYAISNPTITYEGDYGYCKRKVSVSNTIWGGNYIIYAVSMCDIYGEEEVYVYNEG